MSDNNHDSSGAGWSSGSSVVDMFRAGPHAIVTAGKEGSVLVWDVRQSVPVLVVRKDMDGGGEGGGGGGGG